MNEILGCAGCGFVVRADSIEGPPICSECGATMASMSLIEARRSSRARQRSIARLAASAAATEVGLGPTAGTPKEAA
jgi:hypothetical protein